MADCDVQIHKSDYIHQATDAKDSGVWKKKIAGHTNTGSVWVKEESTHVKEGGVNKLTYHHCTCEGRGYCSCNGVAQCSCVTNCTCHSHYCSCYGYSAGSLCEVNVGNCNYPSEIYDNCWSRSYGCWVNQAGCSCHGRCCTCMDVTGGASSGCSGYACHPKGDAAVACPGHSYVYCDCKSRGN